MKLSHLALSAAFGFSFLTLVFTVISPSSMDAHGTGIDAASELRNLNFFHEGRGMHLSPGILQRLDSFRDVIEGSALDRSMLGTLARRWGLQSVDGKLVGLSDVPYAGLKVGVVGCAACHSGKAAGQYIVGIGNKNIDPGAIGRDGLALERRYRTFTDRFAPAPKSAEYRETEASSLRLMEKLANPTLSADTQGLVPVALVGSWFFEQGGEALPTNGYRGATKVPSWFGFGEKLGVGQFADAIGLGHPPGWIVGVEITAGQTAEAVRAYSAEIDHAVGLISALTPPPYPFPIDATRAERGAATFAKTCTGCHGTYDRAVDGKPIYLPPKVIPAAIVGTDPDRLDYVTEDFLRLVRASPLADLIQLSPYAGKRMYVAPRLHAIWARFPVPAQRFGSDPPRPSRTTECAPRLFLAPKCG